MHASVRAFFNEILDYAGLFPPAKLLLEEALRNYLRYRKTSPHRWMLGRFVCPVTRLPEVLALAKSDPDREQLQMTALGQQAGAANEFLVRLHADVDAIDAFRQAWGGDGGIAAIELALPKGEPLDELALGIPPACDYLDGVDLDGYFETPAAASWKEDVESLSEILSDINIPSPGRSFGLKLRCGGLTADAFPSDEQVAFFIDRCRSANLPWKATAGLHHPRRHWDASVKLWHHGFLNVFGAGLLARTNPLTEVDLVEILADRDGLHFHFEENRFAWKEWSCTTAQIAQYRANGATTFGSCSFTEPCEDLTGLGLL